MVVTRAPAKPERPIRSRIAPMSGGWAYLTWTSAPPSNSIPFLIPRTGMMIRERTVSTTEIPTQRWRLPMKSILVSWRIWSIAISSDAQRGDVPAVAEYEDVDEAGDEHRGEDGAEQPGQERDREPLDGAGPVAEEEEGRDDRGHVRVDDRPEGAGEPLVDGGAHRLPEPELLADALEDQHVAVDRHADREDQPGDPREGQRRAEVGHPPQHQHDVHEQGEDGVDARKAVVDEHEEGDADEAEQGGEDPRVDRVLAERRADRPLRDDRHRGRDGPGPQLERQVFRRLQREPPLDHPPVADDVVDHRRGDDLLLGRASEHDRHLLVQVLLRRRLEALSGLRGEDEVHDIALHLVDAPPRRAQVVPDDGGDVLDRPPHLGPGPRRIDVHL